MSFSTSIPRTPSQLPRSSASSSFNLSQTSSTSNSFPSSTTSNTFGSNNNNNNRPNLDRNPSIMSSISDQLPIATNSALNKVGSASSSLYQNCRTLLERLERVPGFKFDFMELENDSIATGEVVGGGPIENLSNDPVSRSLSILRLGSSLCYLFNALGLSHILEVNPAATMVNLKACQRGTAHFIMACKQDLSWSDNDLFAIHELYGQDTNGVVKVINTVTKLLDLLEDQGMLEAAPIVVQEIVVKGPSDDRTMVVKEILDSERKYVQDLEVLQDYQRQVLANDIITQDQIHELFLNLNSLADFQRRFLIGVEANASQPAEQQRFGHLFLQMEDNFSVYEPYCANLTAAQDLAIAENANLAKLSNVLDPISELAPLLIKPVQRLCKYPLLLQTLLKNTPESHPYHDELAEGLKSIMRVTDKVNETKRREDNRQAVIDLSHRVEDWKGHDIKGFGELLLQETFFVIKNDSEREYNVYLFERIILCCKEAGSSGKKSSKSNSILKKPLPGKRPTSLQLKGRIFVNNVTGAESVPRNGQCLLEVKWRGDVTEEAFTIKCRTEELLKQWQRTIRKAVEETPTRRRAHHLSNSRSRTTSERGVSSPYSQFPGTPLSEYGPTSSTSTYSFNEATSPYPNQISYGNFEDDNPGDENGNYDYNNESGRNTPNGSLARRGPSIRSLPATTSNGEERNGSFSSNNSSKPRAQTEDATSAVINQWRYQTPLDGPSYNNNMNGQPTLPRGASHASVTSESQSLRSSASSRQLKHRPSNEWSSLPTQHQPSSQQNLAEMQYGRALPMRSGNGEESIDDMTPRPGVSRQISQVSNNPNINGPPSMRGRSASSPNIYQVPGSFNNSSSQSDNNNNNNNQDWSTSNSSSDLRMNGNGQYGNGLPALPTNSNFSTTLSHKSGGTNSGGTLASASSISASNRKRFSSSSNGTDRSSIASSSQQSINGNGNISNYNSLNGPSTLPPSAGLPPLPSGSRPYGSNQQFSNSQYSNNNNNNNNYSTVAPSVQTSTSNGSAIRVKVTFGEDTFVVVVLSTVSFPELQEKIIKKIRLCGDRSNVDINQLRLRYQDEDGDKILITSEEDVVMAFEFIKMNNNNNAGGSSTSTSTLVLYATAEPSTAS